MFESVSTIWFKFRYRSASYDEALIEAQQALEIEEKELGARDERMAELYKLLAVIWIQVKESEYETTTWYPQWLITINTNVITKPK